MKGIKYLTTGVPVSKDMAETIRSAKEVEALLSAEVDRAYRDLAWSLRDERENGHIGPRHRPTRVHLFDARENLRKWAKHDRWKRSAGTYRRKP